ncbi:MAG: DPP IV N-terminal domain-containing protein, partial [Paludibacter sp.]|nr:DPP IV N-terminal domain-containing protein [Paludibacter sp.]
MKRLSILFVLTFAIVYVNAQLLYDILDGKYRSQLPETPRSMNDGEHYTLKVNNTSIVKYNYKTGAFVDTVMSLHQLKNCPLKSFSGYEFSPNEAKMLIYNNVKYRYRRTFTADYYVVDLKRKEIVPLSEEGNQQEVPLFSPDSRYIAFARQNNLYMKKLDFNTEIAITKDGEVGKILNGLPDWVYEEEFEVTRLFNWSPDSKLLAFVKLDETAIPEFAFQMFSATAETDRPVLYPGMMKFKYPKA